jgi:uncharacterized protein
MQCPVCRTVDLMMTERQGIEIDYCPTCRGVWLDRGELDKILERSTGLEQPRMEEPRKRRADVPMQYRDDDHYYASYPCLFIDLTPASSGETSSYNRRWKNRSVRCDEFDRAARRCLPVR